MKLKKNILTLIICFCALFLINGINAEAASIKVNSSTALIGVGKTQTLKATVTGTSKTVKWTSSNKAIATVSSKGVVKGVKAGKCTIKATANGKTATCTVTVSKLPSKTLLQAYASKLKKLPSGYSFGLVYVNYDLIPELYVAPTDAFHFDTPQIYTYTGGKLKEIKNVGSQFSIFNFVPKKSIVKVNEAYMNNIGYTGYKKITSSFGTSSIVTLYHEGDWQTNKTYYYMNDSKISKSTYDSKIKAYANKYPVKTVTPKKAFKVNTTNINKMLNSYSSVKITL